MKVHILYEVVLGPWGGANQFLKALRQELMSKNIYVNNANDASVLLVNLNPAAIPAMIKDVMRMKNISQNKIVIARLDGPISQVRGKGKEIDRLFFRSIKIIADGVIYQSEWSRKSNRELGNDFKGFSKIIPNAPDPTIFNTVNRTCFATDRKIRIIANSWSNNKRKGFPVYQWLDTHLDFSKYEMVFIGNSPLTFKNIQCLRPLESKELAVQLKRSDIYITASINDPCSNSLLEALQCGLPAVVRNSGGHPEILGRGGEVFDTVEEIPRLLERIVANYVVYQGNIKLTTLAEVSGHYITFMTELYESTMSGRYVPKRTSGYSTVLMNLSLVLYEMETRVKQYARKLS